jgi:hypothetical protein
MRRYYDIIYINLPPIFNHEDKLLLCEYAFFIIFWFGEDIPVTSIRDTFYNFTLTRLKLFSNAENF